MANVYIHKDDEHARMHFTLSNEVMLVFGLAVTFLAGAITFFVARSIHRRGPFGCAHGRYCLCCAADRPSRYVSGAMAAALGAAMTAQAKALAAAQSSNFEAIKFAVVEGAKYTAIAEELLSSIETTEDE